MTYINFALFLFRPRANLNCDNFEGDETNTRLIRAIVWAFHVTKYSWSICILHFLHFDETVKTILLFDALLALFTVSMFRMICS